jgi:hypothetical protein
MQSVMDFPWKYAHCADSTQVAAGPCVLHTITVNRLDTGACIVTVYDNPAAAGNIIAVIDLSATTVVDLVTATLLYDIQCATGLYVSFSAVATADLTVSYM